MDTTHIISKTTLLNHLQCPKRAWLETRGFAEGERSLGQEAILEQGQSVHAAARSLFPGATVIDPALGWEAAARETVQHMRVGGSALIEAGATAEGLGVRFDVLEPGKSGWKIVEAKSGSTVKDEYLDDCAIQLYCARKAGIEVESVEVMHPNTAIERRQDGTGAEVLIRERVLDAVEWASLRVPLWLKACRETLDGEMPDISPGEQCKEPNACPFMSFCGKVAKTTDTDCIAFLPNKIGAVKDQIDAGATRVTELSGEELETDRNRLVWEAIKSGDVVIRKSVAQVIAALPYPRRYLDFEAAGFAIPRFSGMRPFQPVTFQISCHHQESAGAEVLHSEFIDVSGEDPRRAFCEWLLETVGSDGPIMVFSAYERTQLKALARAFPDLADALAKVAGRLVDLLPMAREGYYHPDMRGSWSIKAIEPTLPKDAAALSYAEMGEVADGLAAQGVYALLSNPAVVGPQRDRIKAEALRYCGGDTWNLVRFVRTMESAA